MHITTDGAFRPLHPRFWEERRITAYIGAKNSKRTSNTKSLKENLLNRITKLRNGCWLWEGSTNNGYGRINGYRDGKRIKLYTHNLMWLIINNIEDIPEGKVIRHLCHNSRCVNPEHLLDGTQQDNMDDCKADHRQARGEGNGGAKLTEQQVNAIRNDHRSLREIANDYGVVSSTISSIKNRKLWKHI